MKLLIHIGLPKCASSTIQVFFAKNSTTLQKHDIIYPEIFDLNPVRNGYGQGNAFSLVYSLMSNDQRKSTICNYPDIDFQEWFCAQPFHNGTILLSSEWFTVLHPETLDQIKNISKQRACSIEIIYWYRPINSWLQSEYKQGLKLGIKRSLNEILSLNPFEPIKKFESIFGASNVYGFPLVSGSEPFHDFERHIGLHPNSLQKPNINANVAMCDLALVIQKLLAYWADPVSQKALAEVDKLFRSKGFGGYTVDAAHLPTEIIDQIRLHLDSQSLPTTINRDVAFSELEKTNGMPTTNLGFGTDSMLSDTIRQATKMLHFDDTGFEFFISRMCYILT